MRKLFDVYKEWKEDREMRKYIKPLLRKRKKEKNKGD